MGGNEPGGQRARDWLSYNRVSEALMKRNWNWMLWLGFAVAVFGAVSYIPIFARFPSTRDVPWANLLLFFAAGSFLAIGLYRAFAQPERYRGKISGPILGVLSLGLIGLFCFGIYAARNLPPARTALRVGQRAADFSLAGVDGKMATLSQLRQNKRAVLLIFYRGYW